LSKATLLISIRGLEKQRLEEGQVKPYFRKGAKKDKDVQKGEVSTPLEQRKCQMPAAERLKE